ncbi:MAG: response regulator [Parcubacteria group bacterium]
MPNIIIVEDDPMISEIYQKKFVDSGYQVFLATSGEQTLTIAKKDKIDLVLLDLIMPKMNGFEVLENLRGGGYDPNIKVIVFSNLSSSEDREKAAKLGANGFIAKSEFSPSDLVKEVGRLLGQYQEQGKNESRAANQEAVPSASAKKILMIEDEDIFIEMFGEKLKQEGYAVSFARNGAWGVKDALVGKFDLFIIDMVMPAMSGEEMIAKLKMEDSTKNIPIIVLSASVEDETAKRVEAMGTSAYFVKTQVTPSDLVKKVDELLK